MLSSSSMFFGFHQFVSISAEKWRDGASRYHCEACGAHYDDVIHRQTVPWPLILVIEDCFIPQSARLVIEVAAEQSDETLAILFALAGMKASGEINAN